MPTTAHPRPAFPRHRYRSATLAITSAIALALSIVSVSGAGPEDSTREPEVRVRRMAVGEAVALLDWTWSGDAVFTFEGSGADRALTRWRTGGDRLIEDAAWPSATGHQPIILPDDKLAHFNDRRTLTIIDSRTG